MICPPQSARRIPASGACWTAQRASAVWPASSRRSRKTTSRTTLTRASRSSSSGCRSSTRATNRVGVLHPKVLLSFFSVCVCGVRVQQVSPKNRNAITCCKTLISSINSFHWDFASFPFKSETDKVGIKQKHYEMSHIKVVQCFNCWIWITRLLQLNCVIWAGYSPKQVVKTFCQIWIHLSLGKYVQPQALVHYLNHWPEPVQAAETSAVRFTHCKSVIQGEISSLGNLAVTVQ